jgi:MFS superfamily sulfate permease-like transporter
MPHREGYFKHLGSDLPAGLVVFLVALPLCLGIALASGAPLISGIISGVIGGLVVGAISQSHTSVSGPAAGLTVIVLDAINGLGGFEIFLVAVVLAGVIQMLMGILKLGIIGMYFPSSVIKGMLAAIGLILILKQLPHFIGVDTDAFGEMEFFQQDGRNTFTELAYAAEHVHPGAALVGVVSLLIMILWEQPFIKKLSFSRIIPGALVAVIFGIVFNEIMRPSGGSLFIEESHLVPIPVWQDEPNGLRSLIAFPKFSEIFTFEIWKVAFVIAIIASLETLLSVEAVDKLDHYKRQTPKSRELFAQGVGNTLAGLIGGLPMTAVIVRSSANVNSGAKTKISAIFHALLLIIAVIAIPKVINLIPLSALAAVLLIVGYKLSKPQLYKQQWKVGYAQFIPFIVTIIAVLLSDLLIGILIGLAVGFFFILKRNYTNGYFLSREEHPEGGHSYVKLTLSQNVSFLNKANLKQVLEEIKPETHLVIDASKSKYIDYDAYELIKEFEIGAEAMGVNLELIGFPDEVTDTVHREDEAVRH